MKKDMRKKVSSGHLTASGTTQETYTHVLLFFSITSAWNASSLYTEWHWQGPQDLYGYLLVLYDGDLSVNLRSTTSL